MSVYLSANLKTKLFCETSSIFHFENFKNETTQRGFVIFQNWSYQKRNNSARLPHHVNLTTSKTKQFCEISSLSKLTTSKTKQFCESSFKNGKLRAALTASYQCLLGFFQSICLIYCVYHRKMMPGHTKCCTCDAKSFQQTWRSDASKCNPSQKISARTSNNSDEHISCTVHATENASLQILFKYPMLTIVFEMLQNPHVFLLTFDKVHNPLHLPRETISESPKVVRTHGNYKILKSTCASRHNAVHFFDISTSKNGPNVRWFFKFFIYKCASRHNGLHFFDVATSKRGPTIACFVNFNFQIFFAPQRRALFRHLNFQKWCEREVFLFFLFRNVLRATTACTFSTSQLPKVVRPWCVLYILISTCVSRHNGVHFFDIWTSKSGPNPILT